MRIFVSILLFTFFTSCSSTPKEEARTITDKEKALLMVRAATSSIETGDPTQALRDLIQAEKLAPELPELHHARALAMYAKHDLSSALESAKKAVEFSPDYSAGLNTYGKLLLDSGKYHEAEPPLVKAAKDHLYSESFKAHTNLGILYYRQGRYHESESQVNLAIQDAPEYACVAYYYRGNLRLRQQKYQDSAKDYAKAGRKLCGDFSEAHYAEGIAYLRGRKFPEARKKFLEVRQLFPGTKVAEKAMEQLRYLP